MTQGKQDSKDKNLLSIAAEFDGVDLGPVGLVHCGLEARAHLLGGEGESTAVRMVDDGDLLEPEQLVEDDHVPERVADVSAGTAVDNGVCIRGESVSRAVSLSCPWW